MSRIKKEKHEHVVFVTADAVLGRIYAKRLSQHGFDVKVFSKGVKALKYSAEKHPLCILLDTGIPKEDAREFIYEKQKDTQIAAIPVMALAGSGDKEDIDALRCLGVTHYYVKSHTHPNDVARGLKKIANIVPNSVII